MDIQLIVYPYESYAKTILSISEPEYSTNRLGKPEEL